ncbi:SDR family oxidoreductase [Arthrobacter sp. IA7]|uniref:SDR family NAD(P)-dependent oxidoreductase n=1 Tax=Arthrobacter ipis TaxID=2716202 RepID=UPI001689B9D7|nr:SDR family NAD(P)-dependent oxidoreductase [Arthrobacter ipis]MBD1544580.1 SDR family oxidoreductase [Arthrobacter ipis]
MTTNEPTSQMSGKVALITGASRGIGAAIATTLAEAGAHVVLAARDVDALALQVQTLTSSGGQVTAMRVDVTDEDSVKTLLTGIKERFGRLDAAVNNAAGGGRTPAPLGDWASKDFDSAIAVNLRGVFLCMKYEIELSGYTASKFGVSGLTRVAALDYAAQGIRINAIAPGPILTDRLAAAGQAAQEHVASTVPLGRIGTPGDVAAAALWLCWDQSSFVTGTVLTVDGGRHAGTPAFHVRK